MRRIAALFALFALVSCKRTDPRQIVADRADGATVPSASAPAAIASVGTSSSVVTEPTEAPPLSLPRPVPEKVRPPSAPLTAKILPLGPDSPPPVTDDPFDSKPVPGGVGALPQGVVGPPGPLPKATATHAKPPAGLCSKTPFPAEATADTALVTAVVKVDAKGDVSTVTLVSDPGQGFGREARTCLLAAHFTPATDGSGAPVSDSVTLSVRFAR